LQFFSQADSRRVVDRLHFFIILRVKYIHKTFARQHDQSDCGVAALLSIIRFFGGDVSLERLRELSGTSPQGTTLLGLFQAAQQCGFAAKALQCDSTDNLKTASFPCIVHIVKDGRLHHYIVCYGFENGVFTVGDPAGGVGVMTPEELESVWVSKALLTLQPTEHFTLKKTQFADKRRWAFSLVEADMTTLAVIFALGVAISILSLSTAIFSQKLVDAILPERDVERLIIGLFMLGVLLLARSGLNFLRGRFVLGQNRSFNARVAHRFFSALLCLPQSFFDRRKTGDLIARMNDAQRLQQALTYLVGEIMIEALLFIVAATTIFLYAAPIGAFLLCSVLLYGAFAVFFHKPIVEGQRAVMAMHGLNESNYVDTIQGVNAIKAAGREDIFAEKTRLIYGVFQETAYNLGKVGVRFNLAAECTGVIILLTVLAWSSAMVLQGNLLAGGLVAIVQMASQLNVSALRLALAGIRLQEARVAFERMYAFASLEPEYEKERALSAPTLANLFSVSLRNVSFRFAGRPELVKDASLELRRGEIVAVVGENGSGKTTLAQMIQRFYEPERGEIIVNGAIPLRDIPISEWRGRIGAMPQHVKIFNASVAENICLAEPNEVEIERVTALCRRYDLERFIMALPQGYATIVGEEGVNLSGGQRQIIGLARSLYRNPELLILDEPTAAMDAVAEEATTLLLQRLSSDMAILVITHRSQTLSVARRIYTMVGGVLDYAEQYAK
jgi:ATP-binding cassette subfamily B protein